MQDQEEVTRLPGNDDGSGGGPIGGEEWLIGRRFNVEEERRAEETSSSDDIAEMHKVMCGSDWPDKWRSCENVSRRVRTTVPSVKVTSVDVRQRRRKKKSSELPKQDVEAVRSRRLDDREHGREHL